MDEYFDLRIEEKHSRHRLRLRPGLSPRLWPEQGGFECVYCHVFVSSEPALSGVQNRNHCPYCLWSRHLDLVRAGDRLAACREKMQPVGLALKKTGKKYGSGLGELMLIHRCQECGKVSINRIAADDLASVLYELFEHSLSMDASSRAAIRASGIQMLTAREKGTVKARLFGA